MEPKLRNKTFRKTNFLEDQSILTKADATFTTQKIRT